jgi:hypothetical protein
VDLDLGNYERFLDIKLTRDNNITTGKIYQVGDGNNQSLSNCTQDSDFACFLVSVKSSGLCFTLTITNGEYSVIFLLQHTVDVSATEFFMEPTNLLLCRFSHPKICYSSIILVDNSSGP